MKPEDKSVKEASKKFLVFTSFSSGKHTNFVANDIEDVHNLLLSAFDGESDDYEEEVDELMDYVSSLEKVHHNVYQEFSNGTWITVTLTEIKPLPIEFELTDNGDGEGKVKGTVLLDGTSWLNIKLCGFSTKTMEDSEIIALEVYDNKPMLRVWSDITIEDPTHSIDLSKAASACYGD